MGFIKELFVNPLLDASVEGLPNPAHYDSWICLDQAIILMNSFASLAQSVKHDDPDQN